MTKDETIHLLMAEVAHLQEVTRVQAARVAKVQARFTPFMQALHKVRDIAREHHKTEYTNFEDCLFGAHETYHRISKVVDGLEVWRLHDALVAARKV